MTTTKMNGMKLPMISKEELLDAIREGVHDAVWRMITNATSMPCHDFYDMVKEGVAMGIKEAGASACGDAPPSEQSTAMRSIDKLRRARLLLEAVHAVFGDESDRDVERPAPYLRSAMNDLDILIDLFGEEYDRMDEGLNVSGPPAGGSHEATHNSAG